MLFGFRISAVKIISREVIEKVGLIGMGTMGLEHSGNEIKKVRIALQFCFPPKDIIILDT